ncbi:unnamed protein product, partial [Musa textilis]
KLKNILPYALVRHIYNFTSTSSTICNYIECALIHFQKGK